MKYEDSFISNTFIMGDFNANLSYSADLRPQKKKKVVTIRTQYRYHEIEIQLIK